MAPRRFAALLLVAGLFGSAPALALESARETGDQVSTSKAAIAASTSVAEPPVVRGLDAPRPLFVVAAAVLPLQTWERPPVTRVVPYVHAARPDVVTCPSQGPPSAR